MEEAPSSAYSGQGEASFTDCYTKHPSDSPSNSKADIYPDQSSTECSGKACAFPFTTFNIDTPVGSKAVEIPNSVKDIFLNKAQVPDGNDTATVENVAHTAMLLFAGYIDAATSMSESCGGGGGSVPESGWGKKDDEDERAFASRCLNMAHSMCKPKAKYRGYHR